MSLSGHADFLSEEYKSLLQQRCRDDVGDDACLARDHNKVLLMISWLGLPLLGHVSM